LINYTDGASGLGHVGIMALNPDGSALYGGFNPVHAGSIRDAGVVKNISFPPGSATFGTSGRPTIASLGASGTAREDRRQESTCDPHSACQDFSGGDRCADEVHQAERKGPTNTVFA
jgi:hypothetical protein